MVNEPMLRLVDNRLVLGDSTFCGHPQVVAVLSVKEPANKQLLREIIEAYNARHAPRPLPGANAIVEVRQGLVPVKDEFEPT